MKHHWTLRQRLSFWRRRLHERLGSDRYSRPGLNGLDRRLESWLDFDGGFFIEAGANNGFDQSNTYHLERMRGWRGVLIEPHPMLAARCRVERPAASVVEAALVAADFTQTTIALKPAGLMSMVDGAWGTASLMEERVSLVRSIDLLESHPDYHVPARTLSSILDQVGSPAEPDLLSLDVEGYEVPALLGLDLSRHAPRFICVEARDRAAVDRLLHQHYETIAVLTDAGDYQDVLYRRR